MDDHAHNLPFPRHQMTMFIAFFALTEKRIAHSLRDFCCCAPCARQPTRGAIDITAPPAPLEVNSPPATADTSGPTSVQYQRVDTAMLQSTPSAAAQVVPPAAQVVQVAPPDTIAVSQPPPTTFPDGSKTFSKSGYSFSAMEIPSPTGLGPTASSLSSSGNAMTELLAVYARQQQQQDENIVKYFFRVYCELNADA